MNVARIDDQYISAEEFIKILKLDNTFNNLIERILIAKLTVREAQRAGITVSDEEIQQRADQFRRAEGLHRAQDARAFLEALGVTLDDFERYLKETLYREKMMARITSDQAIEGYFRQHSPKFDSIEISHITVDSEGKARELLSMLIEEPEQFAELVREHSLDRDSRERDGRIGKVLRGVLPAEVEARLFNAAPGELLGPFVSDDGLIYEIFRIDAVNPARLDEPTARDVARMVYDDWLAARAQEHRLEIG
ncbi:MAG: peptidylprolyl isomerase [Candidatus Competibacterales bacterium]|nr:peptidylprolyl isomerase [Candidatus Competibacterales bacterium]